ncbi:AAA family ATPase [Candidatus Woesearchaeota archaeon]|nr:AAA family ATPase [Candidatus Woesearchaeota archaeon]
MSNEEVGKLVDVPLAATAEEVGEPSQKETIQRLEEHIRFLEKDHDSEIDCLWNEIRALQNHGADTARVVSVSKSTVEIEDVQGNKYTAKYDPDIRRQLTPGREVYTNAQRTYIQGVKSHVLTGPVAQVTRLLDQGRVMVGRDGHEAVIFGGKGLRVGDEVIFDDEERHILDVISRASLPLVEFPNVTWDAVGGLDHVVSEVQEVVELPYLYPDVFRRYPLVGGTERKLRTFFGLAREVAGDGGPLVLYVDEIDSIGRERGQGENSRVYDTATNQLLVELDGMNELENVVCMAATNREKLLDSALIRRWEHKIYVPRPSQEGTESIFSIYLKQVALDSRVADFDGSSLKDMAKRVTDSLFSHSRPIARIVYWERAYDLVDFSDLMSGKLIRDTVYRAALLAIEREIKGGARGVTSDDLERAVQTVYEEHRHFPNLVTDYDKRNIAGSHYENIQRVESITSSGIILR